ncbi:MAG TPA: CoA transferase [Gaiellaceae bacterium]|nr:CoA transferase [Gaiellaceae bacterium]
MLPLEDLRVLAIEQFGAGPWGTMHLADLGADVIKIEDPTVGGDVSRHVPPGNERATFYFESFNRNKRSLTLDLRRPESRAILEDLVAHSDAVFSNLRGDQPAKLGIRYEDLAHANERIVCVSLSGFGTTGPRAAEGAYDPTIQALSGWMSLTGGPEQPPTKSGLSLVDFSAGYVAAIALIGAVWQARRDGKGCDVDLSLFETALSLLTYLATWSATLGWEPVRMPDSAHQRVVPFQAFAAADGWIVVACAKETLWRRLCDVIERPDLGNDERFVDFDARDRNRGILVPELQRVFAARPVADWETLLRENGIPCSAVNDVAGALADEQAVARGAVVGYDHPLLGQVRGIASALGRSLSAPPARGPLLGEHNAEILAEVCGYAQERVDALFESGVLG